MRSKNVENPKTDEKVCYNCKHMCWMVGIGQGIRCGARNGFRIPSRWHSCEKFENVVEQKKKEK
jgi:hypothetical protein